MIEFDKCTNCGTSHTFGKGKDCEVLSPRCSVHPDAKIRKTHNEEGFLLGYECQLCKDLVTYQVIRQRYSDGPDGFTSTEAHYVITRGLTKDDAQRVVDLLQEQHKRNADLSFFFLPE